MAPSPQWGVELVSGDWGSHGLFLLSFQNKPKVVTVTAGAAPKKEVKKTKNIQKQQGGNHQVAFSEQVAQPRLPQPLRGLCVEE